MPQYVVLLRGVNVGGANRLPMAKLRVALESAGFASPRTYVASGNVLVDDPSRRASTVASRVTSAIEGAFGLDIAAVAMAASAWEDVVGGLPFNEPDPKRVHLMAFASPLADDDLIALTQLQERSDAKGRRDRVVAHGRVLYLHTPDGYGSSDLATWLASRRSGSCSGGTARNWSTVLAIRELLSQR